MNKYPRASDIEVLDAALLMPRAPMSHIPRNIAKDLLDAKVMLAEAYAVLAAIGKELAEDTMACMRADDYGRLHRRIAGTLVKFATESGA